eukprot:3231357-Pleurochrysis_carterae.AAC.5
MHALCMLRRPSPSKVRSGSNGKRTPRLPFHAPQSVCANHIHEILPRISPVGRQYPAPPT